MGSFRLEVTLREDLLGRLDRVRGHEPRASFVRRVLSEALEQTPPAATVPEEEPVVSTVEPEKALGAVPPELANKDLARRELQQRINQMQRQPIPKAPPKRQKSSYGAPRYTCPVHGGANYGRCTQINCESDQEPID